MNDVAFFGHMKESHVYRRLLQSIIAMLLTIRLERRPVLVSIFPEEAVHIAKVNRTNTLWGDVFHSLSHSPLTELSLTSGPAPSVFEIDGHNATAAENPVIMGPGSNDEFVLFLDHRVRAQLTEVCLNFYGSRVSSQSDWALDIYVAKSMALDVMGLCRYLL
jgi:hypothetical protein